MKFHLPNLQPEIEEFLDHSPHSLADRTKPEMRKALSGPGLRAFFRLTEEWGLSNKQRQALLGYVSDSTYFKWQDGKHGALTYDQLERVSLILGIYKALVLIFRDQAQRAEWLRRPNTDVPFMGHPPLDMMMKGSLDCLYAVRRYLDAWRGVRE